MESPTPPKEREAAFREGELLDPDNARYNHLLANLMLGEAADVRYGENIAGSTNQEYRLVVKDRTLLDRAMTEFMKGQGKPFWSTYSHEMFAKRMSLLPVSRTMVERMRKINMAVGILLSDVAGQRQLIRASVLYGELLVAEGRKHEAIPFLEAWYPLSRKTFVGGFTLIEELVSFSIVRIGDGRGTPALAAAGETVRAEEMRRRAKALLALQDQWNLRRKKGEADGAAWALNAGPLTSLLLPVTGEPFPTKEEMAPERMVWYVLMERTGTTLFLYLFVLAMVAMLLVALRWRWTKGFASAPLLILPGGRDLGRILALSVVLPLAVYCVFTRFSGFCGRDSSMTIGVCWAVAELLILSAAILHLAVLLSVRHTWRRCQELGIAAPARVSAWRFLGIVLIPFGLPVWLLRGRREGVFRGTVARSLIPIFASVVIVVGLTTQPYLAFSERTLVQKDTLFSCIERGEGFSKPEVQVIERLKREVLSVFKEAEADRPPPKKD